MLELLPHLGIAIGSLRTFGHDEDSLLGDRRLECLSLGCRRLCGKHFHYADVVATGECLCTYEIAGGREVHLFKMGIVGKCLPYDEVESRLR